MTTHQGSASTSALNFPSIAEVVQNYGLLKNKGHSRRLGQNFLFDLSLTRRIVTESFLDFSLPVLEVGPGPGSLTRVLLEKDFPHIYAIEYDRNCVQALEYLTSVFKERLTVIQEDACRIEWQNFLKEPIQIVSNLPYNVGTLLLVNWLKVSKTIHSLTLMLQKEVVDRIVAQPGTSSYGRLSVLCQFACEVRQLFQVPPHCFTPAPKVYSSVVFLKPRGNIDLETLKKIELLTQKSFGQRRKMIRSTLKPLFSNWSCLDLDETRRPETLSVEEFYRLSCHL